MRSLIAFTTDNEDNLGSAPASVTIQFPVIHFRPSERRVSFSNSFVNSVFPLPRKYSTEFDESRAATSKRK